MHCRTLRYWCISTVRACKNSSSDWSNACTAEHCATGASVQLEHARTALVIMHYLHCRTVHYWCSSTVRACKNSSSDWSNACTAEHCTTGAAVPIEHARTALVIMECLNCRTLHYWCSSTVRACKNSSSHWSNSCIAKHCTNPLQILKPWHTAGRSGES